MPARFGVAACSVCTASTSSRISSAISPCFPRRGSLGSTLGTRSLLCIPCSQHSFQCLWHMWPCQCPQCSASATCLQGAGAWCLEVLRLQWHSSHLGSTLPGRSAVGCLPYSQHAQDEAQRGVRCLQHAPHVVPAACLVFAAHGELKVPSSAAAGMAHAACLLLAMCSTAGGTRRAMSARGPCWG